MKYLLSLGTSWHSSLKWNILYQEKPSKDEVLAACLKFVDSLAKEDKELKKSIKEKPSFEILGRSYSDGTIVFYGTGSFWWSVSEIKFSEHKLESLLTSDLPCLRDYAKKNLERKKMTNEY